MLTTDESGVEYISERVTYHVSPGVKVCPPWADAASIPQPQPHLGSGPWVVARKLKKKNIGIYQSHPDYLEEHIARYEMYPRIDRAVSIEEVTPMIRKHREVLQQQQTSPLRDNYGQGGRAGQQTNSSHTPQTSAASSFAASSNVVDPRNKGKGRATDNTFEQGQPLSRFPSPEPARDPEYDAANYAHALKLLHGGGTGYDRRASSCEGSLGRVLGWRKSALSTQSAPVQDEEYDYRDEEDQIQELQPAALRIPSRQVSATTQTTESTNPDRFHLDQEYAQYMDSAAASSSRPQTPPNRRTFRYSQFANSP